MASVRFGCADAAPREASRCSARARGRAPRVGALACLVALACSVGAAWAQPKRKVSIDSEPRGASIYLGEKEAGAAGVTPLTLDLPVGETIVIIELANHVPKFETIEVPKGKGKPVKVLVKLEPAAAAIVVESEGALRGARVLVDGEEEGAAPGRVEVPAGTHRVEVVGRGGKSLHSEEVSVAAGQEVTVVVGAAGKGGKGDKDDKPANGDKPERVAAGGEDDKPEPGKGRKAGKGGKGKSDKSAKGDAPSEPAAEPETRVATVERDSSDEGATEIERSSSVSEPVRVRVAPLFEASWRYFDYTNPITTQNTASLNQMGTLLFGARAEVVPVRALENLVLHVSGGYAVPQDLPSPQGMLRATVWRADGAATYRLGLGKRAGLIALVGYSRTRYRFEGAAAAVALVPDVTYSQLRLGVGVSGRLDWLEMTATVENRPVLSGGVLGSRFRTASADGLFGQLTVLAHLGPRYFARADGGLTRYEWAFTFDQGDAYRAEGALDLILAASLSAGASF